MIAFLAFFNGTSFFGASAVVVFGALFMFLTIGVVTYSIIFPGITVGEDDESNSQDGLSASLSGVMRVLREDERDICMAIWKEGGTALQKDVRWTTGLTKVKTHRAVTRLVGRGVITVRKEGNRNKLLLASWLFKSIPDNSSQRLEDSHEI